MANFKQSIYLQDVNFISTGNNSVYEKSIPPLNIKNYDKVKIYLDSYVFKNSTIQIIAGINSTFNIRVIEGLGITTDYTITLTPGVYYDQDLLAAETQIAIRADIGGSHLLDTVIWDSVIQRYVFSLNAAGTTTNAANKTSMVFASTTLDHDTYKVFGFDNFNAKTVTSVLDALVDITGDSIPINNISGCEVYIKLWLNNKPVGTTITGSTDNKYFQIIPLQIVDFNKYVYFHGEPILIDTMVDNHTVNKIGIQLTDVFGNDIFTLLKNWRLGITIGGSFNEYDNIMEDSE